MKTHLSSVLPTKLFAWSRAEASLAGRRSPIRLSCFLGVRITTDNATPPKRTDYAALFRGPACRIVSCARRGNSSRWPVVVSEFRQHRLRGREFLFRFVGVHPRLYLRRPIAE